MGVLTTRNIRCSNRALGFIASANAPLMTEVGEDQT